MRRVVSLLRHLRLHLPHREIACQVNVRSLVVKHTWVTVCYHGDLSIHISRSTTVVYGRCWLRRRHPRVHPYLRLPKGKKKQLPGGRQPRPSSLPLQYTHLKILRPAHTHLHLLEAQHVVSHVTTLHMRSNCSAVAHLTAQSKHVLNAQVAIRSPCCTLISCAIPKVARSEQVASLACDCSCRSIR